MERLLADAEKLTGVKYDINNLGDVYNAIHAVQQELGLTGVAAYEAQTTLTGSFNALKASWTNVLAALTTGEGMEGALANLSTAISNFANTVLTALGNLAPQIPTFIMGLLDALIANAPALISGGVTMIAQIITGFLQAIPGFIEQIPEFFNQCAQAFSEIDWASIGNDLVNGIIEGVKAAGSALFEALKNLAKSALDAAKEALGIASPSKVFASEVGRWLPPGIAVGIESNMAPLNSTIAATSETITTDMARATVPENILSGPIIQPQQPQSTGSIPNITITFTGDLAALGRVLQPHIVAEGSRRGPQLIK